MFFINYLGLGILFKKVFVIKKTDVFLYFIKLKANKYILHDHRLLEVEYKIPAKQYHSLL